MEENICYRYLMCVSCLLTDKPTKPLTKDENETAELAQSSSSCTSVTKYEPILTLKISIGKKEQKSERFGVRKTQWGSIVTGYHDFKGGPSH